MNAEAGLDAAELSRRRIDMLAEADAAGMPPELAEMMYDVAREEGLDPVLAYELVRSGLGVCPPSDGVLGDDAADRARRRMDVIEEAQEEGMSPELAEMMYDVAAEEGLDPVLAYELVRSGLGVAPPAGGVANAADQPASDKYYPTWLLPASPTDDVLRERMLRLSFRRLRSLLEAHADPAEAFRLYAREPDVGVYGF